MKFESAFNDIQGYISVKYRDLFDQKGIVDRGKSIIKNYIEQYVTEKKLKVEGMSSKELVDLAYFEMTEFSFLSLYLARTDVEEININRWDDVKITFSDGSIRRPQQGFFSPQHCVDTLKRMLQQSGIIVDESKPIAVGHLKNNVRITVVTGKIVDSDVGAMASIRIVNPKKLSKEDFIRNGTALEPMLDLLALFYQYGISICFTGETSSGKTTLMSFILSQLPDDKRLITIEHGTREFDLVKRDKDTGEVKNNVIHLITRPSNDPETNIDMVKLLETTLTINPDNIVVAEMKGKESFLAISAANTGQAVMTTIHANSCKDTYFRMLTLSKQMYDMDEDMVLSLATKAFPITVFCKKLKDGKRRIIEIAECEGVKNGEPIMRSLFKYKIKRSYLDENGKTVIDGDFVLENSVSEKLTETLRMAGMTTDNEGGRNEL